LKHFNNLKDVVETSSSFEDKKVNLHYLIEWRRPPIPLISLSKLSKDHRSCSDILGEIVIVIIIPKVIVDVSSKHIVPIIIFSVVKP